MSAADQKRDKEGRFADEGKGAATDAQVCASIRKKLIALDLRYKTAAVRYGELQEILGKRKQQLLDDQAEHCS